MTLEKFIKLFDKEGCIVLLEGKREVLKSDEKRLVEIGRLLAASTKHCVFRSGNAGGADAFFNCQNTLIADLVQFHGSFQTHL